MVDRADVLSSSVDNYGIASQCVATRLLGYPSVTGTQWQSQGHPNWNVVQTRKRGNPTEWQIYGNPYQGIASVVVGTNVVTRVSGDSFSQDWVGLNYFYYAGNGYKVLSVAPDGNSLTVANPNGSAVSWGANGQDTFFWVATTTTTVATITGTSVTYVSGDPFIPFCDTLTVNGVSNSLATFSSQTQITLGTAPGNGTALIKQYVSIANEISNLRLQTLAGANEENFVITASAAKAVLQWSYSGLGKYRPIQIGTGECTPGSLGVHIGMYPGGSIGSNGWMTLAGDYGWQAMLLQQNPLSVNYLACAGGAPGLRPSVAARGADANSGINFDVQGSGDFLFTSGSFGRTNFKIYGSPGTSYLAVDASTAGSPSMVVAGSDANASVKIVGKGTGGVNLSDGNTISRVIVDSSVGIRFVPKTSAVPPANGEVSIEATSNTQLTFRYKGTDGVVRSATLNLT